MKQPVDNYRLVNKPAEKTADNQIKVKASTRAFHYCAYITKLLLTEKKFEAVELVATGSATSNAI